MVKFSPRQTTGSNALPRVMTREWNNVFSTIAHYHGRPMARRLEFGGAGAPSPRPAASLIVLATTVWF